MPTIGEKNVTLNAKKFSDDLLTAWYTAIAPVSTKDADTKFEADVEFCTYQTPRCTIEHAGYLAGDVVVEAQGDVHAVLAITVFEVIEAMMPWSTGVLASPKDRDADQIQTAQLIVATRARYAPIVELLKTSVTNLVVH